MKEKGIQSQKELAELVGTTEATKSRLKTNTDMKSRHYSLLARGKMCQSKNYFMSRK
ncbi:MULTISPECIES: XRE family transcriptional regulator [Bacillus]|uniref:XRE family transcriptional regulator n=1 Tax=Bacillus TaxID=1386 RepID=UPI001F340C50|nr:MULTISPECIES: XRE family transcriptional regulator [Bacillus]WFA06691.1 XRE family transcriptional regulator [Bacillus sp. HSf4]